MGESNVIPFPGEDNYWSDVDGWEPPSLEPFDVRGGWGFVYLADDELVLTPVNGGI